MPKTVHQTGFRPDDMTFPTPPGVLARSARVVDERPALAIMPRLSPDRPARIRPIGSPARACRTDGRLARWCRRKSAPRRRTGRGRAARNDASGRHRESPRAARPASVAGEPVLSTSASRRAEVVNQRDSICRRVTDGVTCERFPCGVRRGPEAAGLGCGGQIAGGPTTRHVPERLKMGSRVGD